jgi:hypothetical protein
LIHCTTLGPLQWSAFDCYEDAAQFLAGDFANTFLPLLQKTNRKPNWISRFGNADVKPNGWLGERNLLPCTLKVVKPGSKPNSGPTSLFTLA